MPETDCQFCLRGTVLAANWARALSVLSRQNAEVQRVRQASRSMKTVKQAARLLASVTMLFVTMGALPVSAQTLDEAVAAYDQGDFATALRGFRSFAEQGNAFAQFSLGIMYAIGDGVPENDSETLRWFRLAAEQGNAPAQSYLGFMYANGDGVPENDSEAVRWFRLAAACHEPD